VTLGESVWLGVSVRLGVAVPVGVRVLVRVPVIVWEAVPACVDDGVRVREGESDGEGEGVTATNAYSVLSSLPMRTVPSPAMAALPDTAAPVE